MNLDRYSRFPRCHGIPQNWQSPKLSPAATMTLISKGEFHCFKPRLKMQMIYNPNPFEIGPVNSLTQQWHIYYVAPIIFFSLACWASTMQKAWITSILFITAAILRCHLQWTAILILWLSCQREKTPCVSTSTTNLEPFSTWSETPNQVRSEYTCQMLFMAPFNPCYFQRCIKHAGYKFGE